MKVLVTGGAGFIGSHLCERLLARGDELLVLDNFNDFYDPAIKRANAAGLEGARIVEGDIRDADLVGKLFEEFHPEALVHLAANDASSGSHTAFTSPAPRVMTTSPDSTWSASHCSAPCRSSTSTAPRCPNARSSEANRR